MSGWAAVRGRAVGWALGGRAARARPQWAGRAWQARAYCAAGQTTATTPAPEAQKETSEEEKGREREERRRRGPWRHLFWAFPATTLFLGCWQVQRKAWKEELIESMAARCSAPATPWESLPDQLRKGFEESAVEEWDYKPVAATGEFNHSKEFHLGPRVVDGKSGFHVIAPFHLSSGETILVNRGWVPYHLKDAEKRYSGQVTGEREVVGLFRAPGVRRPFMPENDPLQNIWFWQDNAGMAALVGDDCLPFLMDLTRANKLPPGGIPVPGQTRVTLSNNHMSYIVTWFSLSFFLSIMAFSISRGRVKSSSPPQMHKGLGF